MTEGPGMYLTPEQFRRRQVIQARLDEHYARLYPSTPEGIPTSSTYDRRGAILQNAFDHNHPHLERSVERIASLFGPNSDPNKGVILELYGINNMGKSSIGQGLIREFSNLFAEMYPAADESDPSSIPPERPDIVYHDFVDTLPAARNAHVYKADLGYITDAQYHKIATVDDRIMDLAFKYRRRKRVLLIGEHPATENFDKDLEPFGPPRGSMRTARLRVGSGQDFRAWYIFTTAQQRNNNIGVRGLMKSYPANQILEMQRKFGIDDDRTDPVEIAKSYQNYNMESAHQNTLAVARAAVFFANPSQGIIRDPLPEYYDEAVLMNKISDNPGYFDGIIIGYFAPRLAEGIFRPVISGDLPNFELVYNPPLAPGIRRQEWRNLQNEHSAKKVLAEIAAAHHNDPRYYELKKEVRRFGLAKAA